VTPSTTKITLKEIAMNKTTSAVARTIAICIAATMGYTATAGTVANNLSVTNSGLEYVVRFSDLDLSKFDGAAALYARLRYAARIVCAPGESREMGIAAIYRACMDEAVANAVSKVNRPLLSQYHQARTKGDKTVPVQLANAN
jgi:UrcA family protein